MQSAPLDGKNKYKESRSDIDTPRSNAGYCFVDFSTPAAAAKALTLSGTPIPNTSRTFKLNWASGGGLADRRYVHFQIAAQHSVLQSALLTPFSLAVRSVVLSSPSSLVTLAPRLTNTSWFRSSRAASHLASRLRS